MAISSLSTASGPYATQADLATAGGLVLIDEESFSAVSSMSLNNVFTATYENYRIIHSLTVSTSTETKIRLRSSGTDTTSGYVSQRLFAYATNVGYSTIATDCFWIGNSAIAEKEAAITDVYLPNKTEHTIATIHHVGPNSTTVTMQNLCGGRLRNTTSYDGFTLYVGAGTMTGNVRVYGYKGA